MEASAEQPHPDGFAALSARAGDGPVVMLNLLAFRPDGGEERYREYGDAVAPLLERAGGRVLFGGAGAERLIGSDDWDLILLVEYPSRGAFLEMIGSSEYQAIAHLRTESLERSGLIALDPGAPGLA